jgi:NADH-quinone oxidoreductase subunit M
LSSGLSLGGFGLTLRALEARFGRLSLVAFHGLYDHTPMLAICFGLTGLASVGFPGTLGFVGTEMLVDGAIEAYPHVGIALVVAAAPNGIAIVRAYFRLFTGRRHVSTVLLAALILGGGLFPQPGVVSRYQAAEVILEKRRDACVDTAAVSPAARQPDDSSPSVDRESVPRQLP